jgi:alkanesulfonate monooxygenase SsuD/methylene tetrahydromethanopterin reductase-like flavin-dependent oxidoreductase (luciferase family)
MLAKEASIVDAASGGRLTLGVGIGGEFPGEWDALDVPVKQRGARMDESLALMKRLWTEADVTHDGRFFSCEGLTFYPSPAQEGGPPLWVGGRTEPAMKRAVEVGSGWLPYLYRPSTYARSVETINNMMADAGRTTKGFGWSLHLMTAIGETREEALDLAESGLRAGYNYDGDYRELAERYCLIGTPDECVEQLKAFGEAGAEDILLSWLAPAERQTEQIETTGREILPKLKSA